MITDKTHETQDSLPFLNILGIKVNGISLAKALSLVEAWVETDKQYQIITPNPEQVVLAQKNKRFFEVLNGAALAIPDGIGLVWAMKRVAGRQAGIKGGSFERLAGTDFMQEICKLAGKKKWRVFLLGGWDSAKQAAVKLKNANENLQIESHRGAVSIKKETSRERKKIIKKINRFAPHFLFVAYGAPHQEFWLAENLPKLKVKVAMGVGGAFDLLAGKVPRAPKFWQQMGFEWLFRLLVEPWRFQRQLALLEFIWLVLIGKSDQD